MGYSKLCCGFPRRQFSCPPLAAEREKSLRLFYRLAAKYHTPCFCRSDSFRLPLANKFPFRLRHIGQKLKHNIRNQLACQIPPFPGVQKGHIQNYDLSSFFLRQKPPLIQYLVIISSKPVDALNKKGVAGFYFSANPAVSGTVKVLSGLFIQKKYSPPEHLPLSMRFSVLLHSVLLLIRGYIHMLFPFLFPPVY